MTTEHIYFKVRVIVCFSVDFLSCVSPSMNVAIFVFCVFVLALWAGQLPAPFELVRLAVLISLRYGSFCLITAPVTPFLSGWSKTLGTIRDESFICVYIYLILVWSIPLVIEHIELMCAFSYQLQNRSFIFIFADTISAPHVKTHGHLCGPTFNRLEVWASLAAGVSRILTEIIMTIDDCLWQ